LLYHFCMNCIKKKKLLHFYAMKHENFTEYWRLLYLD
jgi:hypothetical protein